MLPHSIKIYKIIHINDLPSILSDNYLFCDAEIQKRKSTDISIGMKKIKNRRLNTFLSSHKDLRVGECVPFYFCPRPPMLYMFFKGNHPEIEYKGGQEPIIHLVADFVSVIEWANNNNLRWAFTNSNVGSSYFDDFSDLADINKVDWKAVESHQWSGRQDKKQAEFLLENKFSWNLVEKIAVYSQEQYVEVCNILKSFKIVPQVSIERSWYY